MTEEKQREIEQQIKNILFEDYNLNDLSDEALEEKIEQILNENLQKEYATIQEKIEIIQDVFSSIRGFGVLDSIMMDDTITEVMINGPDEVFIEKSGHLIRMEQNFESERRLEDIIQKIVGMAGREVNQANPIVDTRLPDGSRVNVVLPPISMKSMQRTVIL